MIGYDKVRVMIGYDRVRVMIRLGLGLGYDMSCEGILN